MWNYSSYRTKVQVHTAHIPSGLGRREAGHTPTHHQYLGRENAPSCCDLAREEAVEVVAGLNHCPLQSRVVGNSISAVEHPPTYVAGDVCH